MSATISIEPSERHDPDLLGQRCKAISARCKLLSRTSDSPSISRSPRPEAISARSQPHSPSNRPKGVGLSVNAGVVTGGGYLYIDTDTRRVRGRLQLEIADFLSVAPSA